MSCPSELSLAMHADGALPAGDAAAVAAHADGCPVCRARIAALAGENRLIAVALAADDVPLTVPAFRPPATPARLAAGAAGALLAAALVAVAPALLNVSLPTPLTWINPFDSRGLTGLAIRALLFAIQHGDTVMTSITETAAAAAALGFVAWLACSAAKRRAGPTLLAALACAVLLLPGTGHSLEFRRADNADVLIPAGETIDDTLVVLGRNVEIAGRIEGDLIAVGRRVVIRGSVGGQVITAAQNVSIEGDVGGTVIGFGQALDIARAGIGQNLFAFGTTINAGSASQIGQNAVVFAQRASLAGPVGRDVLGFAEEVEVGSSIGGNLTAYAGGVTLLAPTRVAGNLNAHVSDAERLTILPGATIDGEQTTDIRAGPEDENTFATGAFYRSRLLRFAAAFATGLILLGLVPGLRRVRLDSGSAALIAGGVGLVTLAAVPVAALLAAATIIGIPLAVLGVLLWLASLYFAKIVLAHYVGRRIVEASGTERHFAVSLAVGLLLVLIAISLPLIGGVLNFVLTLCGLGMLVLYARHAMRGTRGDAVA